MFEANQNVKNSKIRFSSNLKIEDNLVFSTEIKAKHCQRFRCPSSSKNKQSWPASRQYWARLTLLENLVQKRISKIHNEQQKVATEACMPTESSCNVHIMLFKMSWLLEWHGDVQNGHLTLRKVPQTHKKCLQRIEMWKNSKIRFSSNLEIEDNLVFWTEIKAKHCQRVRCPTSSKNKQSWPASRQYWARLTLLENLVQKRISKIHNEQQKVATEACMPTESSCNVHIMLFKMSYYWNDVEMSKMVAFDHWENFFKTHKKCLKRTEMWKNSKIRFSSNLKIEDNLVFSTEIKAKHCQRVRCPNSSKNKQSWPASRQYWARLTLLENLVQKRISKIHNEQQKVATEACMPTESSL